ncbi:hypothetical protein KJB62_12580 [Staphylococcus saprophyticus]|uniref:hypothetical protein n=1 Tax=Staphylococcus saprophyticus TaxID=29385 RepID=UPI001F442D10|nr:hypothetical protein [Staphylococcus saprophyticus]MCE5132203.1 hypothetical protein [Staphylococcus saprophyticus]
MHEKLKDYIMIKGKNDLDLLFSSWNEEAFYQIEEFAISEAKIDLNIDDNKSYEFIDQLTIKTNKIEVLNKLLKDDLTTKEDIIELIVFSENVNELIRMELDQHSFGTILSNDVILELENDQYLIDNNLLTVLSK